MKPIRRNGEPRIKAPLPRFLPETLQEKESYLVEQLQYRASAYFGLHASREWQALRHQTAEVMGNLESEQTQVSVMSQKKKIPESAGTAMSYERDRLQHERVNDDTVRLGRNWYMLGDGVSNYQRNVCGVMGEAVGLIMEQTVADIESQNPPPNEHDVARALRMIPDMSRHLMRTVLQTNEAAKRADAERPILDTDVSTTVELVYYASWLQRAFILHIGDSRTYKVAADHSVQQLTRDHSGYNPQSRHTYIDSSLSTDATTQKTIDIFSEPLLPGERLVSVTDGVFANQERMRKRKPEMRDASGEVALRSMQHTDTSDLVRGLVQSGEGYQQEEHFWDDTSAAALERKM